MIEECTHGAGPAFERFIVVTVTVTVTAIGIRIGVVFFVGGCQLIWWWLADIIRALWWRLLQAW